MKKEFFLDTADEDELRRIWEFVNLQSEVDCIGITTNPNALAKIDCNTMAQFEKVIPKLVALTTEMRDGRPGGIVHVQIPSSEMEDEQILRWASWVAGFADDSTSIALKIPHQTRVLRLTDLIKFRGVFVNVTGISDWATLCKAFQYPDVKYASLIPGRMEEVGIDANRHMDYIRQISRSDDLRRPQAAKFKVGEPQETPVTTYKDSRRQQVIAGSMRTIEGLHNAVARGTVPTIGMRVWGDLLKPSYKTGRAAVTEFTRLWDEKHFPLAARAGANAADYSHAPFVDDANVKLSIEFFEQMDKLGDDMYREFIACPNGLKGVL